MVTTLTELCALLLLLLRVERESMASLAESQELPSSLEEEQERAEEEKRGLLKAKEDLSRESNRNTSCAFRVSSTSSSRSSDC